MKKIHNDKKTSWLGWGGGEFWLQIYHNDIVSEQYCKILADLTFCVSGLALVRFGSLWWVGMSWSASQTSWSPVMKVEKVSIFSAYVLESLIQVPKNCYLSHGETLVEGV